MKISAVAVISKNIPETIQFYKLLGFEFPEVKPDEQHVEPVTPDGSARLMIDSHELVKSLIGKDPIPGNHSPFAIEYNSPEEVNKIIQVLKDNNQTIVKEPWDAFWGQRYSVVSDPDGYLIDLYAQL
jgi:catechol 2,3-dioxygenase-like lactoylglutathione lyase family enzyme